MVEVQGSSLPNNQEGQGYLPLAFECGNLKG
ncbi:MAG: hypothetical protein HW380_160 [Magnetococcales bacterium]|nr:hypothetical protein [Magnetococcales bacterium]